MDSNQRFTSNSSLELSYMDQKIFQFTLDLYNNNNIPRNVVDIVIESVSTFLDDVYQPFLLKNIFEKLNNEGNNTIKKTIQDVFKKNKNLFKKFSSEFKRFSLYKKYGIFIESESIAIGEREQEKKKCTTTVLEPEKVFIEYIPLHHALKAFFEIRGLWYEIRKYIASLQCEKNIISNLIQANYWKSRTEVHERRIVLPLFIYFDEFEPGNALGSHATINKLGCTYCSSPCFPPHVRAQLNAILLCLICFADDRKQFGNSIVFRKLIEEMNLLQQNGIDFVVNNVQHKIYFQLCLILGDNAGLNAILGFSESFSANYYCRMCSIDSKTARIMTVENSSLIRTVDSYDNDLKRNSILTGIKERSIFNDIAGYHVTQNLSADIMHDVFEGVAHYVLVRILNDLIYNKKLFSLETLNIRIITFSYRKYEISNKPPIIFEEKIKNFRKLKMSASEMLCFSRYFGLMVGDLVEEEYKPWTLYIVLRRIIDIITSPRITLSHISLLEHYIEDHHKIYQELYGNLKPKFHLMTHYPRIMREFGPLIHFWSMRYESKHRQLKQVALLSSNKMNLPKTLCIKHQLIMCSVCYNKNFKEKFIVGPRKEIEKRQLQTYFPQAKLEEIHCLKYITIENTVYDENTILVNNLNKDIPEFGKIINIIAHGEEIYFLLSGIETVSFNEHLYAYEVNEILSYKILKKRTSLPKISPCLIVKKKQWNFYRLKIHIVILNSLVIE